MSNEETKELKEKIEEITKANTDLMLENADLIREVGKLHEKLKGDKGSHGKR